MKVVKFLALILGFVGSILSLNSCKKDEPEVVTQECCNFSVTYTGNSYSVKYCEDGTQKSSGTYNGQQITIEGRWDTDYTWAYVKANSLSYGGTCAQE